MSVLESVKELIGVERDSGEEATTYRCGNCGTTFESFLDDDSPWVNCSECSSQRVEPVEG